ncbi:MAG: hypothetical protein UV40_C0004G0006 [Parcubacteria group bacterium GW2011_GWA1_42_7]|nr:MAG: hypothetical protein UV34_C0046G0005 [Parcubacteria group bacterium GW2011_GWB1_42_6]KKS70133.1 MAG: hypothetical protein UV40_C0004G0006 [Parcubacteria group bacterium GW2011_GWA1_42_7]KKS91814.1 MAG: hypothetical protein UV67_C0017G0009 [Parcubacteria group bacterium GW2011_GWC1_43_12]
MYKNSVKLNKLPEPPIFFLTPYGITDWYEYYG